MNHVGDINIDDKLRKASAEAAQLKAHLAAATNMKTGALDFTKLNRSLKDSGVSLQHYGETLRAMGPEGQRAFSQLARAVAQSEVPIRRTNKLVKEMSTTLKNSLRWQLSSSILHGFMTSMSDAYNYAKNLNGALTDIRIVSGQSADQMARFAKQANIAAKDLSTTTNEYAKAALIYYQQGLKQQEVTERTEVTVKMANVTGDAAQDVSSYMTAIWNNFNKAGDESVEHYADVMTKLGAATAASTSEIAAGLSKFSAVADTIGLSFDMATSAVTAIVDQTRETPEVVGTALKTIFSRIEGLQQGETMEDGVDLNKYSKGLKNVGVDIMNANGQLKDADQILKEIGDKWETLDKNQQVALAQTTAGVRQYNQFMALFDNWDKVEQNLTLAATAEGTLDQQADIYAESWEAASSRVRASLEGLFDSLLEDDFFIGLLNGFSELIGFIEGTVDALGGMKGVLLAIGAILTRVFSKQMAGGLQNMAHNLQMLTPKGRQSIIDEKREQLNTLANAKDSGNSGYGDIEGAARSRSIRDSIFMQDRFIGAQDKMTDIERDTAKALLDNQAAQAEKTAEAAREADNAKKVQDDARARVTENIANKSLKSDGSFSKTYFDSESKRFNQAMQEINADSKAKANIAQVFDDIGKKGEVATKDIRKLGKAVAQIDPKGTGELAKLIPKVGDSASEAEGKMKALSQRAEEFSEKKAGKKLKGFVEGESSVRGFVRDADDREDKRRQYTTEHVKEKKGAKDYDNYMSKLEGPKPSVATGFVSIANAAANAMMVITMLSGAIQTLTDPDASGWDKFLAIMGALGVAIPIVTSSFMMLTNAETKASLSAMRNSIALAAQNAASQKGAAGVQEHTNELHENSAALGTNTGLLTANNAARDGNGPDIDIDGKSKKKGIKGKIGGLLGETGALGKDLFTIAKAHPAILGVTAAIAALGLMIWGVHRARTADNRAAEEAVKIAQDASAAHDLVIAKMDEMQSHLDTYDQISDSLKDITKGTQEWYNALNDSNQAVLSLIDQFPELAKYVKNIDGRLIITQEGQDWLTEESQNQLNASQNSLMYANSQKMETSLEAKKSDLRQNIQQDINLRTPGQDVEFSNDIMTKAIDAINTQGSGFLLDSGSIQEVLGVSAQIAEALYENSSELIALAGEVSANTAAQEIYSEQIAESHLADSELYKNASDFEQDIINGLAKTELDRKTDELYEEKYKNGAGLTDKEAQEQYAELIGADDFKNKSGNKGEYLIDGKWETIPDEVARLALAANEAGSSLEGFAEKVLETSNNILANEENSGLDINSDVLETVMGFNGETGEIGDVSQLTTEELKTLGQISFTEEDAQALGYDTAALLMEAIAAAVSAEMAKRAEDNAIQANKAVETMGDDVSVASKEKGWTAEQENAIHGAGGTYGLLNSYSYGDSTGEQALANLATDTGVSVDQILSEIDWSQMDSEDVEQWFADALNNGAEQALQREEIEEDYSSDAQEYGFSEDEYRDLTERIQETAKANNELADSMETNEKASQELAKDILRYDKALESVNENSEDWYKTMKSGNLQQQAKIMDDVAEAMGNMLDMDPEGFSEGFLTSAENIELMQQAAQGSEAAYEELQQRAQEDIIGQCKLESDFDESAFNQAKGELDAALAAADFENLEIGADLNSDAALAAMTDLVNAAGMTAEEATSYLSSMGIDAEVIEDSSTATESQEYTGAVADVTTEPVTYMDPLTNTTHTSQVPSITYSPQPLPIKGKKENKAFSLKVTSASKSSGGGFKHKNSSGGGGSGGGGGGGGGGGKATRIKKSPKSSNQKRYEKVTNNLQDLARAQKNAADEADRLYGEKRLKNMDKVSEKIKEQIKLLKETKLAEIKAYKNQDEQALRDEIDFLKGVYGNDLIPDLEIDENYNISNIETYFEFLANEIQKIDDKYKTEGIITEADEEAKALLEERKSRLEAVYEPYKETVQLEEDTLDEIKAFERELQDIAFEKITYKLELEIELNDAELEKIDYFFNKTQKDNIYDMAEGLMIYGGRWEQLADSAEHYRNTYNELQKSFENGEISKDQLIEGQKEAISNLIENAEQMQEFLEYATHEYYAEALEMGIEEIDKYAEGFDRLSDAVDHYMNIASTLGKETDYEYIEKFLNANISNINNKLDASTEKYNMLVEQRNYWEEQLGKYEYGSTEYEQVKKNLEATNEAVEEAYDERLSIVEEKAEAIRALIENKMAQAAKSFEDALTDGSGFDSFMSQFEKLNSRQEEYLTKTNQIYETNKLMRQAAQAADKTDNEVAKRKFKNFENETKKLQENTKLSNYELEIQQAKYDLLLAEIALEEAQNAKSTVRLQRDNEGNFGYVYTANKDEIADAQQKYEDAQNALYNISLQGQQDYTAKYLESLQMMQEELAELDEKWLNGEIATLEEYNDQRKAITDHYFNPDTGVLSTYSKLYNIAVQTDVNATEDYWASSYGNMTTRTEEWNTAVKGYIAEIDTAFDLWVTSQTELNNDLNGTLEDNARFTEDVKTKSAALAETITTSVIPAVQQEIKEVEELTQKWIDYIATMESAIKENEKIIDPEKFKSWRDYGENFDFLREAIRQSQGMGTTDLSIDEALDLRKQKILDSPDLWKQLGYSGTKEEVAAQIDEDHAGVKNSLTRGDASTGWSSYTQDYLHSIAESDSKVYSLDEILRDYTDYSFDMLMLSGDEKYKKYAAYSSYEEAAKARRQKVSSPWQAYSLEILFERAKHESKLAKYLEDLRATFDADNSKYPEIKPEESGIAQDIGNAIKAYASGDTSGYIKNDSDMKEALESRKAVADHFNNLPENERAFTIGTDDEMKEIYKKFGVSFDTGGYTGSWGPQGKLAMLHQKELILNASDTENMLKMIEIVRDLSQQIDIFAARQSLQNSLLSNPGYFSTTNGTLEQSVHIEASFPGVTDRNQIEEAFGNLVNIAYQHANRQ